MNKEETEEIAINENVLIAVYGTLRQGFGNHRLLDNARMVGTFQSEPEYSLYNLGGFPGLKQEGSTSVTMEVYEVNPEEARRVDRLEGYEPGRPATFYDKVPIETPWGTAGVYIYVGGVREENLIASGDYTAFIEARTVQH